MSHDPLESRLHALLSEGVGVEAFLRFRDDLLHYNQGRNLVSRRGGGELVERRILECAAAAGALPLREGHRILDLGSGAGFPGIPFALACTLPVQITLLDRRPVACDFLRRERAGLGLPQLEILEGQSKELLQREPGLGARFDWVLMKAVAPPEEALAMARPFLAPGGSAVLFRDQQYRPTPSMLGPSESAPARWEWCGGIPIPGFPDRPDSPALHRFSRLG